MRQFTTPRQLTSLALISILCLVTACSEEAALAPESDLIVVTGYLFAGEPASRVRLTSTLPIDTDSALAPAIQNARVALIDSGRRYELELTPGDSGYYHYVGTDLSIDPGDGFLLEIEHGDQIVSAYTVVPPKPQGATLSANEIAVDPESVPFFGGASGDPLTVSWAGEEGVFYFADVDNLEAEPVPVEWAITRSAPFNSIFLRGDSFSIQPSSIAYFGTHRVRIYRANQEYADLIRFGAQDPDQLSEPPSNIENGLGIFTAFSSIDLQFEVVPALTEE